MNDAGKMKDNMYNNQITLTCNEGLEFDDGETSKTWTCNALGEWGKAFEGCECKLHFIFSRKKKGVNQLKLTEKKNITRTR